jgi:hypothetical protein
MPFPLDPAPSILWSLLRDGRTAECEVRFVPIGVEMRVLRNGGLLYSHIFASGEAALAWAEEERNDLSNAG